MEKKALENVLDHLDNKSLDDDSQYFEPTLSFGSIEEKEYSEAACKFYRKSINRMMDEIENLKAVYGINQESDSNDEISFTIDPDYRGNNNSNIRNMYDKLADEGYIEKNKSEEFIVAFTKRKILEPIKWLLENPKHMQKRNLCAFIKCLSGKVYDDKKTNYFKFDEDTRHQNSWKCVAKIFCDANGGPIENNQFLSQGHKKHVSTDNPLYVIVESTLHPKT